MNTGPLNTPGPESVEREVRDNLLSQPMIPSLGSDGPTCADLGIPTELVRRIADRVLRSSFDERHRGVVDEQRALSGAPESPPTVLLDRERWPELRAHRPALLPGEGEWPETFPTSPPELRRAAEHVARRLAHDGLPRVLRAVCAILEPIAGSSPSEERERLLRRAGVPTDLAAWFRVGERPLFEVAWGGAEVAGASFHPAQTVGGFRAIDEGGSEPCGLLRVQMTRPGHWLPDGAADAPGPGYGAGSGDNFDVLLRLAGSLPGVHIMALIDDVHADALRASLERAAGVGERVHVIGAPAVVSQWAQDSLKSGIVGGTPAALLPRFASRAEDGAKLDAGDTAALRATLTELTRRGIISGHSPLHFQGGNVMLVRRPDGRSVLLVGEGEIARNAALGLTPAQAQEALRVELGANESLVLPAVGFHLDTEISIRRVGAELICVVPDELAGARLILASALRVLGVAGLIRASEGKKLRTFLEMRNDEAIVEELGALLAQASDPLGNLSLRAAMLFGDSPSDPKAERVGNAQRVLAALDVLAAGHADTRERPWEPTLHPHARACLRSLRRLDADRRAMHRALVERLGVRLVPVPSLSLGNRSASVVNMVHLPGKVLVPVRGGFLRGLDDAALRVLRREFPGLDVLAIPCAESERRGGALHCSVNVFPPAE